MADITATTDNREPAPHSRSAGRRELLLAFMLGAAAMTYVQWSTYEPAGRDSFYHIKMAALLPQIGFPEHFHWLRHTILNDQNVSHHHGLHILMMPFVHGSAWLAELMPESLQRWAEQEPHGKIVSHFALGIGSWLQAPYILGGKLFNIVTFGIVVLLADLIMRSLDVGFRWFWLLAVLALPTDFFLRMSYIRAPVASLAILLAVFYCAVQKRYVWLAALGAIYCHLYGGFVFYPIMVFIIAGCYAVVARDRRSAVRLSAAAAVGLAVGLLSHPYFPENIAFLGVQLFETGLQTAAVGQVRVGSEWRPIHIDYWLQISAFILVISVLTLFMRMSWHRLRDPETLALLLCNLLFLILCLRARRFIEYWPMFCLLSCAALWRGAEAALGDVIQAVTRALPAGALHWSQTRRRVGMAVGGTLLAVGGVTLTLAREAARCKFDIPQIRTAMAFLRQNTPKGSLVFADDWDEFPIYFFYNHHNDYVCGLDPQFTNSKDPVLWERFCVITQGRAPRRSTVAVSPPASDPQNSLAHTRTVDIKLSDIATHFKADYVLVDKTHQPFYRQLLGNDQSFKHVYPALPSDSPLARVASIAIFEVLKSPSEPNRDPVSRGTAFPSAAELTEFREHIIPRAAPRNATGS